MGIAKIYKTPTIAIIILNWNGMEDTIACLRSIQNQQNVYLNEILIDNGSTDNSVAVIRNEYPDITVIETGTNLGYAGGNNVGLKYALENGYEYIFVLNNDTILDSYCIENLMQDLYLNPKAACAGPKQLFYDQPEIIYYAGGIISRHGETVHSKKGESNQPNNNIATDTEWLNGAAVLFRAEALRSVGLFDDRFFLLFEDTDWSLRAGKAGYQLRYVPQARLWHKESATFGNWWSPQYIYYYTRNNFLWIEKNFPLFRRPYLYYHAMKRILHNTKNKIRQNPIESSIYQQAVGKGLKDYVLRRFGKRY